MTTWQDVFRRKKYQQPFGDIFFAIETQKNAIICHIVPTTFKDQTYAVHLLLREISSSAQVSYDPGTLQKTEEGGWHYCWENTETERHADRVKETIEHGKLVNNDLGAKVEASMAINIPWGDSGIESYFTQKVELIVSEGETIEQVNKRAWEHVEEFLMRGVERNAKEAIQERLGIIEPKKKKKKEKKKVKSAKSTSRKKKV